MVFYMSETESIYIYYFFTARLKRCTENTFTTMETTCASNSLSPHTPLPLYNADVWINIGFLQTVDMCKL